MFRKKRFSWEILYLFLLNGFHCVSQSPSDSWFRRNKRWRSINYKRGILVCWKESITMNGKTFRSNNEHSLIWLRVDCYFTVEFRVPQSHFWKTLSENELKSRSKGYTQWWEVRKLWKLLVIVGNLSGNRHLNPVLPFSSTTTVIIWVSS